VAERLHVLLAGGGTAGHVNPLLAVADEVRRRHPDARLTVLGTEEGLEADLVPAHGLELRVVPRVPLPRRPSGDLLRLPTRLRSAVAAAEAAIDEGVDVVVGFGGYVSTPAYLAARRRGVPVVVHEQNARPGLANRLGARWASAVAVTFPGTRLAGAVVTGLPLRAPVARLVEERRQDAPGRRALAARELGLDPARVTLLVTGGSLGALRINTAVAAAAADLLATGAQVLHLAGRGKADAVRDAVEGVPGAERYQVREYLPEMEHALALADVVIGRAGAGTVCELAALGLPAVYVPLPIGNGEQRLNAGPVVAAGGGLLVEDSALDADWVRTHLRVLLDGPDAAETRQRMGAAAASVGVTDAAGRVVALVEEAARAGRAHGSTAAPAGATPHGSGPDERPATDDGPTQNGAGTPGTDPVLALGRVHVVGVGGSGMAPVASLLRARGVTVQGSDAVDLPSLEGLRAAGVQVWVGHDGAHVEGADHLVISSAVRETNPEVARARELGIPVLHRSDALAALMRGRDAVAVAGAHGKTTTTGMIAAALDAAGRDPSFYDGANVLSARGPLGSNRNGTGPAFVAEADESDESFLRYEPLVSVVTNIEVDHVAHFGTRERYEAAFDAFTERIRPGGTLVACVDDDGAARLVSRVHDALTARGVEVVTYGRAAGADVAVGPLVEQDGRWVVTLQADGESVDVPLVVPGDHNALNSAAAWAVLRRLGLGAQEAADALAQFRGTGRRFELRGEAGGVRVFDDYGHHPTEIAALLRSARLVAGEGRVLVLFQPMLVSRTRAFAQEFADALDLADVAVVTDVFVAREDPDPTVTGATIVDRVRTPGRARYVPDRLDAAHAVAAEARPGDLLLTVGSGDVTKLAPVVLDALAAGPSAERP